VCGARLARQRAQKGNQVGFFLRTQPQLAVDVRRQRRPRNKATAVMLDDGLERRQRPVVHVGRGVHELAQTRRLECPEARCAARHRPAPVIAAAQAYVVEAIVREAPPHVAQHAAGLADEQAEAAHLRRAQRLGVAVDPGIEPRWRRHQRAHIGRKRPEDRVSRKLGLPREGGPDLLDQHIVPLEPPQDRCPVAAHFLRFRDRHPHLRLERGRPPVPEEMLAPGEVPQRRRVASQGCARKSKRPPATIRERPLWPMAARTRAIALAGETGVREQALTQRHLLRRERILRRRGRRRFRPLEHLPPDRRHIGILGLRVWRHD
jgi:hypothetical protein